MPVVPILSQKEKSLIERLPVGRRDEFLRKISANAAGPGGRPARSAAGWNVASPARKAWAVHAANLGVVPIHVRPTGGLVVEVHAPPPLGQRVNMIVDLAPDSTPASLTFTTDAPASATFGAAGAKTAAVSAAMVAAGYQGKAAFTV